MCCNLFTSVLRPFDLVDRTLYKSSPPPTAAHQHHLCAHWQPLAPFLTPLRRSSAYAPRQRAQKACLARPPNGHNPIVKCRAAPDINRLQHNGARERRPTARRAQWIVSTANGALFARAGGSGRSPSAGEQMSDSRVGYRAPFLPCLFSCAVSDGAFERLRRGGRLAGSATTRTWSSTALLLHYGLHWCWCVVLVPVLYPWGVGVCAVGCRL